MYYLIDAADMREVSSSDDAALIIQTAIDDLKGIGGAILIQPGSYSLSRGIVLYSNTILAGAGYPELIVPTNSDGIVVNQGSSYVLIQGLRVRGSPVSTQGSLIKMENHGYTIRVIDVEAYNHFNGIYIEGAPPPNDFWGIIIERTHIHDVVNNGLTVKGYGNVLYVKESDIANALNACILLEDTEDGVMEFMNVHCFDSNNYSVLAYNNSNQPVQHKRFIACNLEGLSMHPNTSLFKNCINIAFVDTEVAGMNENGLTFVNCQDVRIIGGRIINNGLSYPWDYAGVYLKDTIKAIIMGAFIYDWNPPGEKTQAYGVLEEGTSDYNIVTGNVLRGNKIAGYKIVGSHTIVSNNIT